MGHHLKVCQDQVREACLYRPLRPGRGRFLQTFGSVFRRGFKQSVLMLRNRWPQFDMRSASSLAQAFLSQTLLNVFIVAHAHLLSNPENVHELNPHLTGFSPLSEVSESVFVGCPVGLRERGSWGNEEVASSLPLHFARLIFSFPLFGHCSPRLVFSLVIGSFSPSLFSRCVCSTPPHQPFLCLTWPVPGDLFQTTFLLGCLSVAALPLPLIAPPFLCGWPNPQLLVRLLGTFGKAPPPSPLRIWLVL